MYQGEIQKGGDMVDDRVLILNGSEVLSLLKGRELEVIGAVRAAYEAHARGESSLPHSSFLRFPGGGRERIIALPAFLGDGFGVAGVKWIASFPGNLEQGIDRASAALILNAPDTGRPTAVMEGSIISAKRTAASAALAAGTLVAERPQRLALVGCGLINFEIARFVAAVFDGLPAVTLFDLDPTRARQFADRLEAVHGVEVELASSIGELLGSASLISFATTAVEPHVTDLTPCQPGTTILHVSLRDLAPELILAADNVVDDPDHVCRAQTSIHLAEQQVGHRDFIRCRLADVTRGDEPPRATADGVTVFSPFGLGVLDLAVARRVAELGAEQQCGLALEQFLPPSWVEWD